MWFLTSAVVDNDEIGIATCPQDQQQHPVSPPDGVVVRLRHTLSLGLADRLTLKSVSSPTDESNLFKLLPCPYTPESVRKRFSIGNKKSNSMLKLASSSSLSSPTESYNPVESPTCVTSSGGPQKEQFDFAVKPPDARCSSHQDDANSLHSGQNERRLLKNTFCSNVEQQ